MWQFSEQRRKENPIGIQQGTKLLFQGWKQFEKNPGSIKRCIQFSMNQLTGTIQSCVCVCLRHRKTPTSGSRKNFWLKGVLVILTCYDKIFFLLLFCFGYQNFFGYPIPANDKEI